MYGQGKIKELRPMSFLKLIAAGAGLYLLSNKAKQELDKITWKIEPVSLLHDVKIFKGGYDMRVTVTNNTALPIFLEGLQGHVMRQGQMVGEVNSAGKIELPAGETKRFQSFVKLKEGALDQIQYMLDKGGLLREPINLNGYLKTSLMDIPVRRVFEFLKIS